MNTKFNKLVHDKSIAICILARDCENALKRNISKVEEIRSFFYSSYVIVVENDSTDNTKKLLNEWKLNKSNVFILSEDTNQITIPSKESMGNINPSTSFYRINKMAQFRNKYLHFIHENNLIVDYLMVIDIDLDDFYPERILESIQKAPGDWGGLFANGNLYTKVLNKPIFMKYYDHFALVLNESIDNEINCKQRHINADLIKKQLKRSDYVDVKSAFGGIGIYKYEFIQNNYYMAIKRKIIKEDECLCEHISFNLEVLNYGKNYVCKNLLTLYSKMKLCPFIVLSNKTFIKIWEFVKKKEFGWR